MFETVYRPEKLPPEEIRIVALEEAVGHLNVLVQVGQVRYGDNVIALAKQFERYITTGDIDA